jgi:hypothetical protein
VITAEQWYEEYPELKNYYQGDALSEIPFPALPTFLPAAKQDVWGILRLRPSRNRQDNRPLAEVLRNLPNELIGRASKDVVDAWSDPSGEHIIAHCRKMTVMLISRSCDVDKMSRKHFLVAPIVAVNTLPAPQKTDEKLRDLRANEIFHWFYLPEKGNLPESFADLSQMVPLHRSFFDVETLQTRLLARLSATGTAALQVALSDFYGRAFGFAPPDPCYQAGRYACSTCFYAGHAIAQTRDMNVGDFFGDCPVCVEDAMWVKLPDPH